jgi:uncharacterized protein (DUF362 family)
MIGSIKNMEKIYIIHGNQPREMVHSLLKKTGALDLLKSGDRVVIKPNLVVSRNQWEGVNTDPNVIKSLVIELKERGIDRITIADGSGWGQKATLAFDICGYKDMARRYGLDLQDLEEDSFIKKPVNIDGPFKSIEIAKTVIECDFLINAPLMKAHMEASITCALKNIKGTIPGHMKRRFHGTDLHRAIAQLNSILYPDLIIVDGLKGNLSWETGNTPILMDRMLIGKNPVEVDSVVADMLGYHPIDIRYIAHSSEGGLGTCDLNRIKVEALNEPVKDMSFQSPPHYSTKFTCEISAEGVCCCCMGNLMFALERLKDKGLLSKHQYFTIGQKSLPTARTDSMNIAVGKCAAMLHPADVVIKKCPPTVNEIYYHVESAVNSR